MIISFILLILILISYYFVNSKEHLISIIPGGQKITYEGDAIRYTCGDTAQVIHNEQGEVIKQYHQLDASIKLGDVYYGTDSTSTANKIQCKCKNGFSIDPADSTKCICPAGNYITNGNCADCASGTYTDEENQTSCKFPSEGKYANSTSSQIDCAAGTWAATDNVARTACANPGVGKYANTSTTEKDCASGTWASGNTTPRTGCTWASPGNYVVAAGRWYQDACPAGTFQPYAGQTSCYTPIAGNYATSSTTVDDCKTYSNGMVGTPWAQGCAEAKARELCEENYGTASCSKGSCNTWKYWYKTGGLSCSWGGQPDGSRKEYIYSRGTMATIGQDYGGTGLGAVDITNKPLPLVRKYVGGTDAWVRVENGLDAEAKELCEATYGTGQCSRGKCGYWKFWKNTGNPSCDGARTDVGSKEFIYSRTNGGVYTKIGQDYGGTGSGAVDITNKPLPLVRKYVGGTSRWELVEN